MDEEKRQSLRLLLQVLGVYFFGMAALIAFIGWIGTK